MITDYLRNMERDERQAEDEMKNLKLGRWNVGLRAGLVKYDKGRYEEEREEFFERLAERMDVEEEDIQIRREIEELEKEDMLEINNVYDQEAANIQGLDEDYRDGMYYPDDRDDDDDYE